MVNGPPGFGASHFMCALVYNMMCVACCVHLWMIGYIWKTKNTRVREHDHRCSRTMCLIGVDG